MMVKLPTRACFVGLAALAALSGCARAHARTMPALPPLEIPAPPPREVEIAQTEVPIPLPLPEEPSRPEPSAIAGRGRPAPAPARPEVKPEAPRPEAPPTEPPAPVAEEAPKPPATLQTTPAAAEGQIENTVRSQLMRAMSDLNRINVRGLNSEGRTQYDTAKSLVKQAQEALTQKNLVFAKSLADKAMALAAQLAGR
jgi:type IV secretory pathway VirB10-like protein